MRIKNSRAFCVVWAMFLVFPLPASAQSSRLTISSAAADPDGQALNITGANFGARPLVTLDLRPVAVRVASASRLVAAVPVSVMPPGNYLLTVSRGSSSEESASLQITLGGSATAASGASAIPLTFDDAARLPKGTDRAAQVGDRAISIEEIDREWQRTDPAGYLAFVRQLYESRHKFAEQMVADDLIAREATARGLTSEALLAQEVPKRIVRTPDSAVAALYAGLGDRARGATLDQLTPAIRAWLTTIVEPESARLRYLDELMKASKRTAVVLEAPRVTIDRGSQDPVLGKSDSPVEIVAFGDFGSSTYMQMAQAFPGVRDTFGDRVDFVFKNLPMTAPESLTMAEAAACANAQGKFWPYHDALVKRTRSLDVGQLKALGRNVGVSDGGAFDTCIDREEFEPAIRQAVLAADRYAITSSPTFLVNGRLAPLPTSFVPPSEFFKRLVEQELLSPPKSSP